MIIKTLLRDKIAAEKRNEDSRVQLKILSKPEFQTVIIVEMLKAAGRLFDGNNEMNIQILAELETFIRHLAEINKIPFSAIENMYNTLAGKYGLYNAQIAMEIDNEPPKNTDPVKTKLSVRNVEEFSGKPGEEKTDKTDQKTA